MENAYSLLSDTYGQDHKELTAIADKLSEITLENCVFVCVGSDRILADCFGPLCGSFLAEKPEFPVFGTVQNPVHKENLNFYIDLIRTKYPNHLVVTIDAATGGDLDEIGEIMLIDTPLNAASAVETEGILVGEICILGITGCKLDKYNKMYSVRLSQIIHMARSLANTILSV